jgi:hypothetical protein
MEKEPSIISKRDKLKVKDAPIVLTDHLVARFKERYKPLDEFDWMPENEEEWLEKIETLFRDSTEVTLKSIKNVHRLINSGFEEARYFYNKAHHLRFITLEENGSFVIKTVEIPDDIKKKNDLNSEGEESPDFY